MQYSIHFAVTLQLNICHNSHFILLLSTNRKLLLPSGGFSRKFVLPPVGISHSWSALLVECIRVLKILLVWRSSVSPPKLVFYYIRGCFVCNKVSNLVALEFLTLGERRKLGLKWSVWGIIFFCCVFINYHKCTHYVPASRYRICWVQQKWPVGKESNGMDVCVGVTRLPSASWLIMQKQHGQ